MFCLIPVLIPRSQSSLSLISKTCKCNLTHILEALQLGTSYKITLSKLIETPSNFDEFSTEFSDLLFQSLLASLHTHVFDGIVEKKFKINQSNLWIPKMRYIIIKVINCIHSNVRYNIMMNRIVSQPELFILSCVWNFVYCSVLNLKIPK